MKSTYSNENEKDLCTNIIDDMIRIDIVLDVKMAEMSPKSICSIFFCSRSEIQST